jgi:hypothetical protein
MLCGTEALTAGTKPWLPAADRKKRHEGNLCTPNKRRHGFLRGKTPEGLNPKSATGVK